MGCASSGPLAKNLVEGAKDTVHDISHLGENALHDVGEAAKDGMDQIKETVDSAVHTVGKGLGTVVDKIEDTIGIKKEETEKIGTDFKEAVDGFEEASEKTVTKIGEEISEAETILASEFENVKDLKKEITNESKTDDNLELEDIEEVVNDAMGTTVHADDLKNEMEELISKLPTPAPTPPPELKEEPPTPWEIAADAIINRPIYPSMRTPEPDKESNILVEEHKDEEETGLNRWNSKITTNTLREELLG